VLSPIIALPLVQASDGAIPFAAVIAAAVTGAFTLLQLVISKENKVSELQQGEVDGLRADLSKYIAATSYLAQLNARDDATGTVYVELARSAFDAASTAQACILMRLGGMPADPSAQALDVAIREIRDLLAKQSYDDATTNAFALIGLAQPVLVAMAKRIGTGQPFYRFTRGLFLGIFLLSIGFLILAALAWLTR